MASVRQKNGKWYYRFSVPKGDGSYKSIERGGFKTKKEAQDTGNALEAEYKNPKIVWTPRKMSYEALCGEWMDYAPNRYKLTTIEGHQKELRSQILPRLKDYDISTITTKMCQDILSSAISNGHTINRLMRIKNTLKQSLAYAVMMGYIRINPMNMVKLPAMRSKAAEEIRAPRKQRCISHDEIEAIFKRFPEGHPCFLPLLLGYRCGLRLGEAYGIYEEDINLENKTLSIRRQIQYDSKTNELYVSAPKYCKRGEGRTIDLDDDTALVLRRHLEKIQYLRNVMPNYPKYYIDSNGILKMDGGGREIHLLNIRPLDGTYVAPRTMRHVGRVIHGYEGDFEYVDVLWDFHALRHTHASELISNGMPATEAQKRLGHKRLETIYRYYLHSTEETTKESKRILNGMF